MKFSSATMLFAAAVLAAGCAWMPPAKDSAESHQSLAAAATHEGQVVVYSVTSAVPALLEDFRRLYPGVKLEYVTLDTGPLYDRVVAESTAGRTADVVWSSAMDLQIKLVADGHAMSYRSPEASKLPAWAIWRDQAYGTTFEPVGFVYNKNLLDAADVPQTRAALIKMLGAQPSRFKDKITAFDPANSGLGYLLMTQELNTSGAAFWDVAKALGQAGLYPGTGSGAQFERLAKGESVFGYNLLASYAEGRIRKDLPQLGVVLPKDHTPVVSRIMFISRNAAHPNAAKLWLDYVLSKRGQEILAKSDLGALHADVAADMTPGALGARLGTALKPIAIGPSLLTPLEADKRDGFLRQWNAAVRISAGPSEHELSPSASPRR